MNLFFTARKRINFSFLIFFFLLISCSKNNSISEQNVIIKGNGKISNGTGGGSISIGYDLINGLKISTSLPNFSEGGALTYNLVVEINGSSIYSQNVNTKNVSIRWNLNRGDVVTAFVFYGDDLYSNVFTYGTSPNPTNGGTAQIYITPPPNTSTSYCNWVITSNTQNTKVVINWDWGRGYSDNYYYFLFQIYNPERNEYNTVYDSAKAMNNTHTITINRIYTSYTTAKIDFWMAGYRFDRKYPANEFQPGNPVQSRYIFMGGNVTQFYTHGFMTGYFPFILDGFPPSE